MKRISFTILSSSTESISHSFPALLSALEDKIRIPAQPLSNRPQVSMVYRLINHAGCW